VPTFVDRGVSRGQRGGSPKDNYFLNLRRILDVYIWHFYFLETSFFFHKFLAGTDALLIQTYSESSVSRLKFLNSAFIQREDVVNKSSAYLIYFSGKNVNI
jgi:hypothetical protein